VNIIDTKPDDVSIGSEIIGIVELNSDSISLEVLIGDDFDMVSIGYDDVNNNQRECYQDFNVTEGDKIPIDAACYEKFASLTVFFYSGDDFDIDECEACSLPSDATEGYIAIIFEVPCDPIVCEPIGEPSTSPVLLSPAPTACIDQVEVNIIDTKPDDVSIGSEIIGIVELNSDSISLEVLIGDDFDMVSIGYDDVNNNQRECYQDFNVTEGDKIPIDAACYEKFASLTVFFYSGDDFDIDECEACSLPSDATEGYIAIIFEVPCDPIVCEATGEPLSSSTSGPSSAPSTNPSASPSESLSGSPSVSPSVSPSDSFYPSTAPSVNPTESAYPSTAPSSGPSSSRSKSTSPSRSSSAGPSKAPSMLTSAYPSTLPSASPSDSPSHSPSGFPSISPTSSPTITPTDLANLPEVQSLCVDYTPIAELTEGIGDVGNYPWDTSLITINKQLGSSVMFTINQQFSTETPNYWSIHYEENSETHDCDAHTNEEATYGSKFEYTAVCHHGQATISVYLRNDGTNANECDTCGAPLDGALDFVAYYVQIPCEPECIQEEPECYAGIMAMHKDTGGDSMCEYSSQPFIIEELDDAGSNEVRFSFTNNWPATMSDIELLYNRGDGLGEQCQSLNSLSSGAMYPNTLAVACNPATQTANIEVYVNNNSIKHSSSRNKCGAGSGSCSYVYRMPCSTDILCDDVLVRRLGYVKSGPDENDNNEQGFMTEEMKAAGEPSKDSEDAPYCVHKDYPCKGDVEKMVRICHYSRQKGFQTFCIPEEDSDMIQFGSRNHCGPCDGWNGIENTDQII